MRPRGDYKDTIRAKDAMSSRVVTLRAGESMRQAATKLLEKGISGAPVLDAQGRPAGVLTKTDIARYERDHVAIRDAGGVKEAMRTLGTLEAIGQGGGFHLESEEDNVSEWMTPKIVAVGKTASLAQVVREMLQKNIHRIFVRDDESGRICGVITSFDILRFVEALLAGRPGPRRQWKPSTSRS